MNALDLDAIETLARAGCAAAPDATLALVARVRELETALDRRDARRAQLAPRYDGVFFEGAAQLDAIGRGDP